MAIKCSLMGCEYDDTHIEREEERRGEEVILTVREFKECKHCGNTELISENTGVTAVASEATDEGSTADEDARDESETDPETATESATDEADAATDPELDAGGPELDEESHVEGTATTPEEDPGPTPGETGEDDAVILEESPPAAEAGGSPGPSSPTTDHGGRDPTPGDATPDPTPTGTASDGPGTVEASAETDEGEDWTTVTTDDSTVELPEAEAETEASEAADQDGDGDDAVVLETTATEDQRTGGLDERAAMEDGPSITGAIREAEEEYPEDDAVILESSGSDDNDQQFEHDGWPDHDGEATTEWPDHDEELLDETGTGSTTTEGVETASADRTPGAERTATTAGATGEWPDHGDVGGADGGFDATPQDDTGTDVSFSGLTPTDAGDGTGDGTVVGDGTVSTDRPLAGQAEPTDGIDPDEGGAVATTREKSTGTRSDDASPTTTAESRRDRRGRTTAGSSATTDARTSTTGRTARLQCSDCEHAIVRSESPHRAGDICPECARGYLQAE